MKTLVILFEKENKSGKAFEFLDIPFMDKVYFDFFDLLLESGLSVIIVRGLEKIIDNSTFTQGFIYLGKGEFKKTSGQLKADIVWDRTFLNSNYPKIGQDCKAEILNLPEFKLITENKWETYKKYPKYFPKTLLVKDTESIIKELEEIETEKFVFKPLDLYGGKGVELFNKKDISIFIEFLNKNPNYLSNSLVQEFCDSSIGIKGVIEGNHDLRFMTTNKKILLCYLRTPTDPNEFRSNYSLGGKLTIVETEKLPKEVLEFIEPLISEIYEEYKNPLYSIDLFNTTKGLKLIELNGPITGFPEPGDLKRFYDNLLERFV